MAENDGNYKAAGICGILILLCGVGDFLGGIVWIAKFTSHGFYTDGSGLWSGVLLIIAGVLGIAAWVKRNRGLMIAYLVLCIIACIVASIQAIVSGVSRAIWVVYTGDATCYSSGQYCICSDRYGNSKTLNNPKACDLVSTLVGGLLAFIILSVFGALFTLAGSIIGCIVCCGSQQRNPGAVVVHQPAPGAVIVTSHTTQQGGYVYPAQQPMGYAQQQPMGYPQQPMGYPQQQQAGAGYPQQQQTGAPPQYAEKAPAPY